MKKIVIASDSFKGSLTSREVAEAAAGAVRDVFPRCEVVCLPVADGGEGTLDALCDGLGGERVNIAVQGPSGRVVQAEYGIVKEGTAPLAIIEMARASGLPLVPPEERNPMNTSSFGTGELISDALRRGCRRFVVGLGGSATNDAGIGMLAALGWRFLDDAGRPLPPVGASLRAIAAIDDSGVSPQLAALLEEARHGSSQPFEVACDVDIPFCGPEGAALNYSAQKGADPAMAAALEEGMVSFAKVIENQTGTSVVDLPYAGAAGGLGGAFAAFLGARLRSGAELVLDAVGFDRRLRGADLVITGEGRLDAQTARGKLPYHVLQRARAAGIPVLALAGSVDPAAGALPFADILCVTPPGLPLRDAMRPDIASRNVRQAVKTRFVNP